MIVLAILAVALAIILLAEDDDPGTGLGGSPSASAGSGSPSTAASGEPSVSTSPSATGSPPASAAPGTPVVEAPTGFLPPGSLVEVTADGLRLREQPSTSAMEVGTVSEGDVLYLYGSVDLGPIGAEDFTWYPVLFTPGWADWPRNPPANGDGPSGESRITGWVATGTATESFVSLRPPRCPSGEPDLSTLEAMTDWERLACYGDRQITFTGTYGCGGCGGLQPGTFEPAWLIHPIDFNIIVPDAGQQPTTISRFLLRIPPDVQSLQGEAGSILQVTGHFDDPRAAGCVVSPGEPERPAHEGAAVLLCREQFVVETWEVIGTDPDWTGG